MRKMQAKFPGRCGSCGGNINRGDTILWSKADGAAHADKGDCEYFDGLAEQRAEMKMEEAFEMRISGAWAYNAEYGGYEDPPEPDDFDGRGY